ncbi:RNA-binding protein NOB1-like [Mizuhopecten yessoensis]|uniref:RNA-binding protein NOB1 n=1 Tax=Mizuhopecten yessoensis TaxID=6573 RepID=A0A210PNH1_MIZYE|nr:RNA-binding protein NOB1-like [Mizuhopecten yessoensis]OWF37986.1 RNA-binding protein NOB1 [Mizuhopecten yessoensis]
MADTGKVQNVIADAGAFIRNAPLQSIGEKIYSLPEVVNEIRDKATRQRLQVLPYQLHFRQPSSESIRFVTEFAKKTGDYRSLSAVDIKVMALTYQLEKEVVGSSHIKITPDRKIEWNATRKMLEKPTDIAGFYISSKANKSRTSSECTSDIIETRGDEAHDTQEVMTSLENQKNVNSNCENIEPVEKDSKTNTDSSCLQDSNTENEDCENDSSSRLLAEGDTLSADILEEESEEEEEEEDEDDDDDDDDDGWITPSNIKSVKERMGDVNTEKADVSVGCLTTDFAIQNVLIQMGLNVISVDGMLIKKAKSYVLRCYACLKITSNVLKEFCPTCGNNTLQKVTMTVEDDGSIRYFLSRRRPVSTRGTKFSLPLPKGGKHAVNPILAEDTPVAQQRSTRKSKQKIDALNPDFVTGSSPFNVNDITSRASQLGIKQGRSSNTFNKRNPNEVRKNYGKRK